MAHLKFVSEEFKLSGLVAEAKAMEEAADEYRKVIGSLKDGNTKRIDTSGIERAMAAIAALRDQVSAAL